MSNWEDSKRNLMNTKTLALGVVIGALLTAAYFSLIERTPEKTGPRPKLFVGRTEMATKNISQAPFTSYPVWPGAHPEDILLSCPDSVLVLDANVADYRLSMRWDTDHWEAGLLRKDSALLFHERSPDFNQVVRNACKAIKFDMSWVSPPAAREASADRYELKDLHNGPTSTTALIDRRTGRVWVWTNFTDNKGQKTGKTEFLSEDVVPDPESQE